MNRMSLEETRNYEGFLFSFPPVMRLELGIWGYLHGILRFLQSLSLHGFDVLVSLCYCKPHCEMKMYYYLLLFKRKQVSF